MGENPRLHRVLGANDLGAYSSKVLEAVIQATHRGTGYGARRKRNPVWPNRLSKLSQASKKVRLVSSGTEATMSAIAWLEVQRGGIR